MNEPDLGVAQRRGTLALADREVRRVVSLWTQTILPPALTAILFLAVFGGALGRRVGDVEGLPYPTFILPGLLVMTVAGQAFANASTSLFQAKSEGYVDDLLTAPLRGRQLVAAYVSGSLVRCFSAAAIATAAALAFVEPVADPVVAAVALFLTGVMFSALGVITGVWAETFDQHSFLANIVITPLALVGGVFYSARTLDEPWSTLTRLDPIYYLVDATRGGFTGVHESPVWISLAVAASVCAATLVAAAALIESGWRLKP